jgi:peptide/nickel transport system substrate-binding protein
MIAVEDAARIFIVHDFNPRALSPRVIGFVQARSWYHGLTRIVVTSPPN